MEKVSKLEAVRGLLQRARVFISQPLLGPVALHPGPTPASVAPTPSARIHPRLPAGPGNLSREWQQLRPALSNSDCHSCSNSTRRMHPSSGALWSAGGTSRRRGELSSNHPALPKTHSSLFRVSTLKMPSSTPSKADAGSPENAATSV